MAGVVRSAVGFYVKLLMRGCASSVFEASDKSLTRGIWNTVLS